MLYDLWRHVLWSACEASQASRLWVDLGSEAKVCQLNQDCARIFFIFKQDQVITLDVTMDDVLLVQELQSEASLTDNRDGLLLSERDVIQSGVEILAFQVLLDHVEVQSVLKDVVHSDDVLVLGIHQNFELVDQQVI